MSRCKVLRPCYKEMVETLRDGDEAACIEDASIGASTVTIFLKAIKQFCGNLTQVFNDKVTYEGRHLYEVHISEPSEEYKEEEKPIILIEAGQEAGTEPISLALYLIEQLVSCQENHEMIQKARWVILPCTNPDGQEYSRFNRLQWRKNLRPSDDNLSYGVDISRNFEGDWKSCPIVSTGFSSIYPGPAAGSENETAFVQGVLSKYRKEIKGYLSIRRDGHSISYSYGYDVAGPPATPQLEKAAAAITARVNQRAGGVHLFKNQSIFELNGKARCGHSVDYAHQLLTILYSFEMRVFLGSDSRIMAKFQNLPRGYEATLRSGYYSGIKELYNIITKENRNKSFLQTNQE
ncbi:zinc carboxypeptidase A 1-like [Ostrinia furnacalis]|uniref:zinc carboxypeptidase A 1-like n=1 Tax=Ostrinia furnacalis TaxID=93504 RepID=UPI00103BF206|nr:zinc carboxypeptidase A 1-like [Ostrinia furnacalis]